MKHEKEWHLVDAQNLCQKKGGFGSLKLREITTPRKKVAKNDDDQKF
jgi:hypothetical protein